MTYIGLRTQKKIEQRKKIIYIGLRTIPPMVDMAKAVMAMPFRRGDTIFNVYGRN